MVICVTIFYSWPIKIISFYEMSTLDQLLNCFENFTVFTKDFTERLFAAYDVCSPSVCPENLNSGLSNYLLQKSVFTIIQ